MDQFLQFVDFHWTVLCRSCGKKVMDPDKKKGQTHLKGKCPSCGQESKAEEKKSRKQRKKEKREARARENENQSHRAKY